MIETISTLINSNLNHYSSMKCKADADHEYCVVCHYFLQTSRMHTYVVYCGQFYIAA